MFSEQKDLNRCLEPMWRKVGFNLQLVELLLQIKLNWSVILDIICKIYRGAPAGGVSLFCCCLLLWANTVEKLTRFG